MSEVLIRLSQIINCMESAGKVDNPDSRHRILAQYREEASWHIRVLEEQECTSRFVQCWPVKVMTLAEASEEFPDPSKGNANG